MIIIFMIMFVGTVCMNATIGQLGADEFSALTVTIGASSSCTCVTSRTVAARVEGLTVELLKLQVFWEEVLCC